jgi:hypothetical protein
LRIAPHPHSHPPCSPNFAPFNFSCLGISKTPPRTAIRACR